MDPLFWILAGVVSVCVIGIIVLWLLERQATRRLALEQAEESARLKAIDPREALEEIDTHPIPATPPAAPGTRRQPPPAPLGPAFDMTFPGNQQASYERERAANGNGSYAQQPPMPPMQAAQPSAAPPFRPAPPEQPPVISWPTSAREEPPVISRPRPPREEPARPAQVSIDQLGTGPLAPTPQPPAVRAPSVDESPTAPAPAGATSLEPLRTTPERASLRAAELTRERNALERLLEETLARLDTLLRSAGMAGADDASSVSQMQSEIARQREHLQELAFLEQHYRQIASALSDQFAQQQRSASPDTPRAFGVRRHSLARVDQPGQRQGAPYHQPESEP
jgi:hypothetical protein